jgi:addiction module RelE/StbE family toxin
MIIRWTEPAADSLERIYAYIETEANQAAAAEMVQTLLEAIDRLELMPMIGRAGTANGVRELVRPPYVIVYTIVEEVVNVINIVHGSQRV